MKKEIIVKVLITAATTVVTAKAIKTIVTKVKDIYENLIHPEKMTAHLEEAINNING